MDCFIIVPNDVARKFDIKKENTYWGVSSSVIYTENMIRVSLSEVRSLSLSLSLSSRREIGLCQIADSRPTAAAAASLGGQSSHES